MHKFFANLETEHWLAIITIFVMIGLYILDGYRKKNKNAPKDKSTSILGSSNSKPNNVIAKNHSEIINTNDKTHDNRDRLKKISKEKAQQLFTECRELICNREFKGPPFVFLDFMKLIFIKLDNDKELHDCLTTENDYFIKIPKQKNKFSTYWIESQEESQDNPINNILFQNLIEKLHDEFIRNSNRIIFDNEEKIDLQPTTIKAVVEKLEEIYLFSNDEYLMV